MTRLKFFSFLMVLSLVACSPMQTYLKTDTTAFYKQPFESKGSIVVFPGDINLNNSLEFESYKQKVQEQLVAQGYSLASDTASADFVALLLYAVDDGKQSVVYTPIYGRTGQHVNSYIDMAYNDEGKAVYIHTNYLSPSFGVVGASAQTKTNYRHTLAIDIVTADSLNQDQMKKVFEGRTISKGKCSVIVEVFDEMLEAMFTNFPGENGRNKSQTIEATMNCP
jgi:hypothetical protein